MHSLNNQLAIRSNILHKKLVQHGRIYKKVWITSRQQACVLMWYLYVYKLERKKLWRSGHPDLGPFKWKTSWWPLRANKILSLNWGLLYAKEPVLLHDFNAANDKLIQVRGLRHPPKKCTNLTVWFGAANFGTFLEIFRPHKLGSTYRLLRWNRRRAVSIAYN